jgi:hypothetical protein
MLQAAYKTFRERLRDFYILEPQRLAISDVSAAQRERLQAVVKAAMARSSVADDLVDPPHAVAAIVLYREAVTLLLLAVILKYDSAPNVEGADAAMIVSEASRILHGGTISSPPAEVGAALGIVSDNQSLRIDLSGAEEQARTKFVLESAADWLRHRLDLRTSREIRRARLVGTLAGAAASVLLLALLVALILRPTNLARNRPVQASSRAPQSLAPADGSGLVNGVKEHTYGIHTNNENSPWVMVDLQSSYAITQIAVYNRGEGWFDESLPLVLELSENGRDFVEVSRRAENFSQEQPWIYASPGVRARYIRVRAPHVGYLALSEIEVNGHR